jgi:hypothetical protein
VNLPAGRAPSPQIRARDTSLDGAANASARINVDAGINAATHLGGQRCGDHEDRGDSTNHRKSDDYVDDDFPHAVGEWQDEDYDVLADGVVVGRIYEGASASTPRELRWFWSQGVAIARTVAPFRTRADANPPLIIAVGQDEVRICTWPTACPSRSMNYCPVARSGRIFGNGLAL